jgi:hypothetical protein
MLSWEPTGESNTESFGASGDCLVSLKNDTFVLLRDLRMTEWHALRHGFETALFEM